MLLLREYSRGDGIPASINENAVRYRRGGVVFAEETGEVQHLRGRRTKPVLHLAFPVIVFVLVVDHLGKHGLVAASTVSIDNGLRGRFSDEERPAETSGGIARHNHFHEVLSRFTGIESSHPPRPRRDVTFIHGVVFPWVAPAYEAVL